MYSKTCLKQPLSKRPKIGFQDQFSLNAGQNVHVYLSYWVKSSSLFSDLSYTVESLNNATGMDSIRLSESYVKGPVLQRN